MNEINIKPQVNAEAEFLEILNDFGNPLELLREAISNSIDAQAKEMWIEFTVAEIEGSKRLIIALRDDGTGMTEEVLTRDFWGLGFSPSRDREDAIGEKGHGTKIYLRSERVEVKTQTSEAAYSSICDRPLARLSKGSLHQPTLTPIPKFREGTGTEIRILGYNDSERSKFVQDVVKDYILWFTKAGSIEHVFGIDRLAGFRVHLKCIGHTVFEPISFGHYFPSENENIQKLFDEKGSEAADWYVKRYIWKDQRLQNFPEISYD